MVQVVFCGRPVKVELYAFLVAQRLALTAVSLAQNLAPFGGAYLALELVLLWSLPYLSHGFSRHQARFARVRACEWLLGRLYISSLVERTGLILLHNGSGPRNSQTTIFIGLLTRRLRDNRRRKSNATAAFSKFLDTNAARCFLYFSDSCMFDKMSGGDISSMLLSPLASDATHCFRVSRFYIELRLGGCAQGELPALTKGSPRTTTWVRDCRHSSSCRTYESEARLLNVFSMLDIGNRDSALRLNLHRHRRNNLLPHGPWDQPVDCW